MVIVSSKCIEICGASSQSATITCRSANKRVLMSSFLEHFVLLSPLLSILYQSDLHICKSRQKGAGFWRSSLIFIGCVSLAVFVYLLTCVMYIRVFVSMHACMYVYMYIYVYVCM